MPLAARAGLLSTLDATKRFVGAALILCDVMKTFLSAQK